MFVSTTIAIVIDNVDPSKMHRIKVKFTTDTLGGRNSHSSWCRMLTPMAGGNRGMVILPDIGTEVVVGFAYRSMTPYILGAVYNGVDLPEPYRNDDCLNNVRVFWSRNDHMVVFDDTEGAEKVGFGAQAPNRLDVTSAGMHGVLDSSQRVLSHQSDGDTIVEAGQTISIRCANFRLDAEASIDIESGNTTTVASGSSALIDGGTEASFNASAIQLNPSSPAATPQSSLSMPQHSHPPVFGSGIGLNALSGLPEGSQGSEGGEVEGETDAPTASEGDAWDELREKTASTADSAVDDAVSDLIGGRVGEALGDAAGSLAARGVDAAFDAAEEAISSAFRSGDGSTSPPSTKPPGGDSPASSSGSSDPRGPDGSPAKPTPRPTEGDAIRPEEPSAATDDSAVDFGIDGREPKPDGLDPSAPGGPAATAEDAAPSGGPTTGTSPPAFDAATPVSGDSIGSLSEDSVAPTSGTADPASSEGVPDGSYSPGGGDGPEASSDGGDETTGPEAPEEEPAEVDSEPSPAPAETGEPPSGPETAAAGSPADSTDGAVETGDAMSPGGNGNRIDAEPVRDEDGLADRVREPGPTIDDSLGSEQRDGKQRGSPLPSDADSPFDIDGIIDDLNLDDGEG